MDNSPEFRRQCEARFVLKMSDWERESYFKGVQEKRGERGLNELKAEFKAQEALVVLKMEQGERQAYYRGVEAKRGTEAAHELVAEVKRQRKLLSKKQSLEMEA